MKYSPIISTTLLLITLSSCWKKLGVCKDASLSITSKPIIKKLRLDGYYYVLADTPNLGKALFVYIYENGIVYYKPETFLDSEVINGTFVIDDNWLKPKQKQIDWGAFRISDNDTIEFERWRQSFDKCFRVDRYWGHIINDSTFELNYAALRDFKGKTNGTRVLNNSKYYFHKHPIKPDSTNDFVK